MEKQISIDFITTENEKQMQLNVLSPNNFSLLDGLKTYLQWTDLFYQNKYKIFNIKVTSEPYKLTLSFTTNKKIKENTVDLVYYVVVSPIAASETSKILNSKCEVLIASNNTNDDKIAFLVHLNDLKNQLKNVIENAKAMSGYNIDELDNKYGEVNNTLDIGIKKFIDELNILVKQQIIKPEK